jgi:XTP/dITP diphosphohydrolase
MKLVLASHNRGKLAELHDLFAPLGVTLVAQSDLNVPAADEPFGTFVENALAKARHAAALTGLPALADDAGLCLHALGGLPGVDTAHFGQQRGFPAGDAGNVQAVLEVLRDQSDRRAALVSTLVAVRSPTDPEPLIATGRASGVIAPTPVGEGGFGFDPVMWLPELGCTFAQLSAAQKNERSHRGQAARQMLALLRERWL